MMQKPGTPSSMTTKSTIFNWIKQILPDSTNKMKVEDLGDGIIYCRIMNHYFPGTISTNRLNTNPKNQYDYTLNLKLFQNALTSHKITVPFDVGKIAKQKFLENWGLVNALYRQLSSNNEDSIAGEDSKSVSYIGPKFTPKRSFETAFPNQQSQKLSESQSFAKPVYNAPISQSTVHYQSSQIHPAQPMNSSQNCQSEQNRMPSTLLIPQNNASQQASINQANTGNNGNYHQSGITQSAFGGFNFGMHSNLNGLNLSSNNNQNISFSRPQTITNRELIASQGNGVNGFDQQLPNKCWSVGKLPTRQSMGIFGMTSQQNSGKYSVNSHIFQSNYNAVIDRVKQILLKNSHDIQKIRQIKILLNIPITDDIVKIEEDQNIMVNSGNTYKTNCQSALKERQIRNSENKICTKQKTQSVKQKSQVTENNSSKQVSNCGQKENQTSKSISNSGSYQQMQKNEKPVFSLRGQQSSGKKIRNNFFGEGAVFRK